ncbi:MAG: hypothetical protein AAF598_05030, partial [Bacteroidota bacterium]
MKSVNLLCLIVAFVGLSVVAIAQPGDYPPNAEPGKCYAKCMIPDQYENVTEQVQTKGVTYRTEATDAVYETVTETVEVKAPSTRIVTKPAVYETVTETVETKAASTRLEVVPAVFETVTETYVSKEASTRLVAVPAEFETVTETYVSKPASTKIIAVPTEYTSESETIEVAPATTKWVKRKADRNCLSANPDDCLVWCLVEVPARYETVTRRVAKACAFQTAADGSCYREETIPEQTATRTRKVVKTA